jgi:hypothetical protein
MVITTELVYQGLLLSSVFLMVLGFPKIVILTLWSWYRIWTYENIHRMSKFLNRWLTEEQLKAVSTPESRRSQLARELSSYIEQVKKPLIESFSAAIFMLIAKWNLEIEQTASTLLSILIVMILIVAIVVAIYVARCSIKLSISSAKNVST